MRHVLRQPLLRQGAPSRAEAGMIPAAIFLFAVGNIAFRADHPQEPS
jgi:hypothetical protein